MDALTHGISALGDVDVLLGLLIGCGVGMFVGLLPGVTATMAIAIATSFTFSMKPEQGLAVLLSIWIAAMYGDRIPAILVNAPGTPAAIATTFDGFPMAQQGKAALALVVSTFCSAIGAIIGILVFALLSFPLARLALEFGPSEYFALAIFGLSMMISVSSRSMVKGLLAGLLGLGLAVVGSDPILGYGRLDLGVPELRSGVGFIPFTIGLFGIGEVLNQYLVSRRDARHRRAPDEGRMRPTREELRALPKPTLIGGVVGALVGAIPAAGGDIGGIIAWDQARRWSKRPDRFGKGSIEGLAAADTANTADVGGSLTTTMALGIPGDSVAAVLLGSLLMWGITPGPTFFRDQPDLVYTMVGILLAATVLLFLVSLVRVRGVAKLLELPRPLLWSAVVLFCLVGTYSVANSLFDVGVALAAGVLGLGFRRFGVPLGPVVLGLLLGELAEANLRRQLVIDGGSVAFLWSKPITVALLAVSIAAVVLPAVRSVRNGARERREGPPAPPPTPEPVEEKEWTTT
jgi:putative tricarboxylic transport membrane protein